MQATAALVALLGAVLALLALGDYTYPECSATGTGCCDFGTGSMRNRGYVVIEVDGEAMIVTCKSGTLLCATGNPGNTATMSTRENVTCPDFEELFESRASISYLEGVSASKTTSAPATSTSDDDESGPGTVTTADD